MDGLPVGKIAINLDKKGQATFTHLFQVVLSHLVSNNCCQELRLDDKSLQEKAEKMSGDANAIIFSPIQFSSIQLFGLTPIRKFKTEDTLKNINRCLKMSLGTHLK